MSPELWSHYMADGRISTTDAAVWLAIGVSLLIGAALGMALANFLPRTPDDEER